MRLHHVLDRDPTVRELVGLQVGVGEGRARVRVVVLLGEEARGSQDDAGETLVAPEKPTEILGRGLVTP